LFNILKANITITIGVKAWKPFAFVGYNKAFDTAVAMVEFDINDKANTVAGS